MEQTAGTHIANLNGGMPSVLQIGKKWLHQDPTSTWFELVLSWMKIYLRWRHGTWFDKLSIIIIKMRLPNVGKYTIIRVNGSMRHFHLFFGRLRERNFAQTIFTIVKLVILCYFHAFCKTSQFVEISIQKSTRKLSPCIHNWQAHIWKNSQIGVEKIRSFWIWKTLIYFSTPILPYCYTIHIRFWRVLSHTSNYLVRRHWNYMLRFFPVKRARF